MSKFILSAFGDEINMDLKTQMDVLEKHHIKFIEMRGVNGKGLVEYELNEVEKIKKQMDSRGFRISSIGSPIGKIGITDDFEPHMKKFKHTLDIANIMECKYIRMFSFYIPFQQDPALYRNQVLERWGQFIKAAESRNVILLHENEKEIYGDTAQRCFDLLSTLKSKNFKAIFDPANFIHCNEETYPGAYNILKEYIEYVHVKDARLSDHKVVPAGEGDGKIKEILTDLYNSGFEGFVSIEPHLGSFKGLENLERNIDLEKMPDGGPHLFEVAVNALKDILKDNDLYTNHTF